MSKALILSKDPFNLLDAYSEEAFVWAQEVAKNIAFNHVKEKDPLFISLAFAYIFSAFIYVSMKYSDPQSSIIGFIQDHFNKSIEEIKPDPWTRMNDCRGEIFTLMQEQYGSDPLHIYRTLYDAILVEVEDDFGDMVRREPYDFDDVSALSFVLNGLSY